MKTKLGKPQYRTIAGKQVVVLDVPEYERLVRKAEEWEPDLPVPNGRGNYPLEALDVLLARDILRTRRELGLSQTELARRAGIRLETLSKIEKGHHKPSESTVVKIDRALRSAEKEKVKKGPGQREPTS